MIKLEEHPSKSGLNKKERLELLCKVDTQYSINQDETPLLWNEEKIIKSFGDFSDYFFFDKLGKKYFIYIKA